MNFEQFIEFVIDLAQEELYEKFDGNARAYFLGGGCYELVKIIKNYIPDSQIVINNQSDHCGIKFNNEIFDADGIVNNKEDFSIATVDDIKYMNNRFNIPEKQYINGKTISEYLIEEIKKCNIIHLLDCIEKDNIKDNNDEIER